MLVNYYDQAPNYIAYAQQAIKADRIALSLQDGLDAGPEAYEKMLGDIIDNQEMKKSK